MVNDVLNVNSYSGSLLTQSIPGLLISLGGLILTGNSLDSATHDKSLNNVPLLLEANCILSFKGNIELIFAMYLSSFRQSPIFEKGKYFRYVFDNSNLVMIQSAIIGLTIGMVGTAQSIFSGVTSFHQNFSIISSSFIACSLTSMIFIILLILSIELAKFLKVNPDNVILPMVSSIGDLLNVKVLIYLTKYFKDTNINRSIFWSSLICSFTPIFLFFTVISKKRLPLQSAGVLFLTYTISTISGYALEKYHKDFSFLASSSPVFSGMSVAIAFIYLHKIFTSINNQTTHNSRQSYVTLIFTSFWMSIAYLIIAPITGISYNLPFCILFTMFFILQVIILLKIVERLLMYLAKFEGVDNGVYSLPLITSISDLIGTIFLLIIALILKITNF